MDRQTTQGRPVRGIQGWDLGLEAEIWASKLGFGPQGGDLVLSLGFGPRGWDLVLKDGIWASRLVYGPQGWDLGLEAEIWALRLGFGSRG